MMNDARVAVRRLRSQPGFTRVCVLTLGLGIGATSAIFSVVYGVLLRPLPYPAPRQLVSVALTMPGIGLDRMPLDDATYFTFREQNRVFEDLGLARGIEVTVTGLGEPARVPSLLVTDGLFGDLGIQPALGRTISADDTVRCSPDVVMIDYGYWQGRLGGALDVVGRSLDANGQPHRVVGVLPPGFRFPLFDVSLVFPLRLRRTDIAVGGFGLSAFARLSPGVDLETARADISRLVPVAIEENPGGYTLDRMRETEMDAAITPLPDDIVGNAGSTLWFLLGSVFIVMLVACVNVANLFLARAEGRRRELAVRAALGASKGRLLFEQLAESVALALLGGATGLALAYAGMRVLRAVGPGNLPRLDAVALDGVVLTFTIVVSLATGVVFGLVPAWARDVACVKRSRSPRWRWRSCCGSARGSCCAACTRFRVWKSVWNGPRRCSRSPCSSRARRSTTSSSCPTPTNG